MPQKLTAGAGRHPFALYKGVVRDCRPKSFAPANALLHRLACRRDGHSVEPPPLFWRQRFPVVKRIGDIVRRRLFYGPAKNAELLPQRRVDRDRLAGVLLKLGRRQTIRPQALEEWLINPKLAINRQWAFAMRLGDFVE